jgi:hypothetical protein
MLADIATGHSAAADVLFLIAAVLFVIEGLLLVSSRDVVSRGVMPALGLASLAVGWLVL